MLPPDGLGHLTYSTLVHPRDTRAEMWVSLQSFVPAVKARVSPDARFGYRPFKGRTVMEDVYEPGLVDAGAARLHHAGPRVPWWLCR